MSAGPSADYMDLFMRAAMSGGLYTGIFRHEAVMELLSIFEAAVDNCLETFQRFVSERHRNENLRDLLLRSVNSIPTWDNRIIEEETERLVESFPKIDLYYRGTIMVFLQESLKYQYSHSRIQLSKPRLCDFYFCFMIAFAEHTYVQAGGYFDTTRYLERKLVLMDALRFALQECVMRNLVLPTSDPGESALSKRFMRITPQESVSNPDVWNQDYEPAAAEPQEHSPTASFEPAEKPSRKDVRWSRPIVEPPPQQYNTPFAQAVSQRSPAPQSSHLSNQQHAPPAARVPQSPKKPDLFAHLQPKKPSNVEKAPSHVDRPATPQKTSPAQTDVKTADIKSLYLTVRKGDKGRSAKPAKKQTPPNSSPESEHGPQPLQNTPEECPPASTEEEEPAPPQEEQSHPAEHDVVEEQDVAEENTPAPDLYSDYEEITDYGEGMYAGMPMYGSFMQQYPYNPYAPDEEEEAYTDQDFEETQ